MKLAPCELCASREGPVAHACSRALIPRYAGDVPDPRGGIRCVLSG